MEYNWWLERILNSFLFVFRDWAPPYFLSRWWSYHGCVLECRLVLCSESPNSLISLYCSGDIPVTIEFPTDPGISTSMSLRYLQAVLGFFQNARCITVGRSSPASARVSTPPDLKEFVQRLGRAGIRRSRPRGVHQTNPSGDRTT